MNKARFEALRRNKFYLFLCRFFVDLNALNAVVQLFYLQRGLTTNEIYLLGVAWSIGTLLMDVPTSYLADRWGRKNTILLGILLNVAANGYLFFAYGFWPFFINAFFLAVSYSFFFGVEDAFLYDNSKEMKQEGVVLKTAGKYSSAGRLSKILTPLIGVLIARNLEPSQFTILLFINFLSSCLAVIFALLLKEPKRHISKLQSHLNLFTEGVKTFWQTESLRVFAINKTLIFIASFVFWRYYQSALYKEGFSVLALGSIYPISNALLVLVFVYGYKLVEKLNHVLVFNFVVWITLASSVLYAVTDNYISLYLSSIILLSVATIRDPFFFQQIHYRIKSFNRATTASILGVFKSVLDIPLLMISGYLSTLGGKWVMMIPIMLSLLALLFFRVEPRYIINAPRKIE